MNPVRVERIELEGLGNVATVQYLWAGMDQ
jgi:hypothetical protein